MRTDFMMRLFAQGLILSCDSITAAKCIGGLLMLLPLFCSLFLLVAVIAKQIDEGRDE